MKLLAFITTVGLTTFVGQAQAADLLQLRQAEKISIALTGGPLSDDMRAKFIKDEITLEQIANQLSSSPDFIQHFSAFWAKILGIQAPINVYELAADGRAFQNRTARTNWLGLGNDDAAKHNVANLTKYYDAHKSGPVEIAIKECPDGPLIVWNGAEGKIAQLKKAANEGIGADDKPILEGTTAAWKQILSLAESGSATCDEAVATVKPWWDPEKVTTHGRYENVASYKIPQPILERCGPALKDCNLRNANAYDKYMDEVGLDLTMEPAYLIAHTVAEDKPFGEVLTTQNTILTGTFGHFMNNIGNPFWANFPGGKIKGADHAIFKNDNPKDRKHYWVARSAEHAGILTTPSYQLLTNGRRAKANKAYETFLCKKFVVPDGATADPEDANPDLTKRAYCSYCHKSLEPMAAFFNRWPTTGVNNYIYNNDKNVNDTGRFNGLEGNGAPAFGKIMAESETFNECSVRRAFEFVNGRKMDPSEIENKLPGYVGEFQAQKNMRSLIKAMLLSPEFLNPKGP